MPILPEWNLLYRRLYWLAIICFRGRSAYLTPVRSGIVPADARETDAVGLNILTLRATASSRTPAASTTARTPIWRSSESAETENSTENRTLRS